MSAASEPEIQALDAAAHLGPIQRLRVYTDVHSFSQVHFWVRNDNMRLAQQTSATLSIFSDHHQAFPAGKYYYFAGTRTVPENRGIGSTDEYFTFTYQVPSWTLETEPSGGQSYHSPLPGNGADYGGVSENGHDGFILPESEIKRVREELAQSFAAVYYRQAGPPAAKAVRIFDADSGALVVDVEWDVVNATTRELYFNQLQPLQLGRSYDIWTAFTKPMRWRENGEVVPFPGRGDFDLPYDFNTLVGETDLSIIRESEEWLNQAGGAPGGYMHYQDDAHKLRIKLLDDSANQALVNSQAEARLRFRARDMTGLRTDANPATVADWSNGAWSKYENEWDSETNTGGYNTKISYQVTSQDVPAPFLLEPGMTSAWYDPAHDGEGFLLEMLANNVAVLYWFTYDGEGKQDWYVMVGEVRANRIVFPNIFRVSGGVFGPEFDPEKITEEVVGSASFLWSSCDTGDMSYRIGTQHGRLELARITRLMGLECGQPIMPPVNETAFLSGSWSDPAHDGEGFNIEVLFNSQVLVYWFSYDPTGNRRWFFGVGDTIDGKLVFDDIQTTSGGIFGPDFDPLAVQYAHWGTLELDLNCSSGTATYVSMEEGFGSGTLNLQRLTSIDQLQCPQ